MGEVGRAIYLSVLSLSKSYKRFSIPHFVLSVVAFLPQDDKTSLVKQHRQRELELRRKTYRQAPPPRQTLAVWCYSLITNDTCAF